jgi:hypothetical protein
VLAFVVLPYRILRRRAADAEGSALSEPKKLRGRWIGSAVAAVARRRRVVLPIVLITWVAAIAVAVQIEARFDVKDYFWGDTDFVVGLDKLDEQIGQQGGEPADIYLEGLLGAATVATFWSNRSAAGATGVKQANAQVRTRGRRIGFVAWITVISVFSLGVFVVGIYSISVSWEVSGLGQAAGMAVMITYFARSHTRCQLGDTKAERQPTDRLADTPGHHRRSRGNHNSHHRHSHHPLITTAAHNGTHVPLGLSWTKLRSACGSESGISRL